MEVKKRERAWGKPEPLNFLIRENTASMCSRGCLHILTIIVGPFFGTDTNVSNFTVYLADEPRSSSRGREDMGPHRGAHLPPAANRVRRHSDESSSSSSRGPTPAYPNTEGDQYGRGYSGSPRGPAWPTVIEEGGQHGWYPASADQSFNAQYHCRTFRFGSLQERKVRVVSKPFTRSL
ncbi:hypothetical protein BT96DRAFT_1008395 [Gymnopus androsaceus JB14]|uniref:Uncharacterized protein n=1 Tax=Gymnopus androsaceus JB14 TaxID=1447944 RepID=A0A6A4GEZ0_9AGAR|nr:hypothetical protein BT96DRAFT_1008395 [Gymnopus androsaceus JB14]